MSNNVVALDESKIEDFNAWIQVVTSDIDGNVSCAMLVSLSKDKTTSDLYSFRTDSGDATFIAALASDFAKKKRYGEK